MKKILIIITLLFVIIANSYAYGVGTWTLYPSYNGISDIEVADNQVYVLALGNLYSYNTKDGSLQTYDKTTGLTDRNIEHISWNATAKRLVITYEDYNIDLLSPSGTVENIPDLYMKEFTGDKTINTITQYGKYAYLSTGFGILKVDVQNAAIADSYILNYSVQYTAILDGYIYALKTSVTDKGIMKASLSDNLNDKATWKQLIDVYFKYMFAFNGKLIGIIDGSAHVIDTSTSATKEYSKCNLSWIKTYNDLIICGKDNQISIFDKNLNETSINQNYSITSCAYNTQTDEYWANDSENNLTSFTLQDNSFIQQMTGLRPDGPASQYSYRLCLNDNTLYMTAGAWSFSLGSNGRKGQVMCLNNNSWSEFEYSDAIINACGRYWDVNSIAIDPNDAKHAFVGSFNGLYEFYDGKFQKRWGTADGLQTYDSNPNKEYHVIVTGLKYDTAGNLYVLNTHTEQPLFCLTKDGKLEHLATGTTLDGESTSFDLDGITIDGNNIWFVNEKNPEGGIYRYDKSTDQLYSIYTFEDQDGNSYTPGWVYCSTKDKNGNIWIGTNLGPFYIKPENISSWTFTKHKVPRNDGTNYADYLLDDIDVRCIAVDGGNRKWMGTDNNGLFVISDDCNTQIQHFTSEDSPLPSDRILDIAIDDNSGNIYISTDKGLCSYVSDATAASDNLDKSNVWAYPNPVTPEYTGEITVVGLEYGSQVIITTASGQKVAEGKSNGGSFTWSGCDQSGNRVASGVYMVNVAKSDGSKGIVTKIAVIK